MITRTVSGVIAVLGGWLGVLAMVMLLSDRAPAALVMLPGEAFLANLPADVAITARTAVSVTVVGQKADFAADLYRAGALLVLPAGLRGCAPLDTTPGLPPRGQSVSAAGP